MKVSKHLEDFQTINFQTIKKYGDILLISVFALMASLADYIILHGQKSSAIIMVTISACIFFAAQSNLKLGKIAINIGLACNILILILTFNTRVHIFNILLLSFILWYIITPYIVKIKGIYGILFSVLLLASYLIPFTKTKIPLFILVMYPIYLLGYKLKDIKVTKVKYGYTILLLNFSISSVGMLLFLLKTKEYFPTNSLRLVSLNSHYQTAVYQPFWGILLIWLSTSFCLLIKYFYNVTVKKDNIKNIKSDEFEILFKKLHKQVFSFLSFLFFAFIVFFVPEYIIRGDFVETINTVSKPPLVFNLIVLSTIYLCFTALIGRVIASTIIFLVMAVLTIANFIKFKYFDEPFYPWDTYIIKEGITISKQYVNLPLILICILVFVIAFIMLLIFNKKVRNFFKPKFTWKLCPLALALLLINGVIINIPSQAIKFSIFKSWYIGKVEMFRNGLIVQNYIYLKDYDSYVLSEPPEYSMEKMEEIKNRLSKEFPQKTPTDLKPNILLVMCESFWDPTQLNHLHFSEDIMKNFNKYKKGEIVSPAIGGGTSNVEFEALTGFSSYFLGPGVYAYNVYFRRDTPSIASVLKDNGYDTIAIHPYMAEMYNRDKVYNYIGFDEYISLDSFTYEDYKGPYVSDERLMDRVIEILSKDDEPKFIWALTMQNHDPYIDKYDELEVSVTSDKLDEETEGILSTYSEGVRDGADSLEKLIKALENTSTPTLVYFFGDHLPRMGDLEKLYEIYELLNPEEDPYKKDFRYYIAPYASWSNFKETTSFEEPFSPSLIALEILKDSGVKYPSYFNILEELKEENMFLHQLLSKDVDMESQYIKDYELIMYDLILGNQYLNELD